MTHVELHRIVMSVLVMVHCPSVQHYDCVFRDKVPIIGKVLRGNMRGAEPERVMAALDFLDDSMDIWKACLVFHSREPITAYNSVKLFLSPPLNLGVSWDQGREPLHNGSRLGFLQSAGTLLDKGEFKCGDRPSQHHRS